MDEPNCAETCEAYWIENQKNIDEGKWDDVTYGDVWCSGSGEMCVCSALPDQIKENLKKHLEDLTGGETGAPYSDAFGFILQQCAVEHENGHIQAGDFHPCEANEKGQPTPAKSIYTPEKEAEAVLAGLSCIKDSNCGDSLCDFWKESFLAKQCSFLEKTYGLEVSFCHE